MKIKCNICEHEFEPTIEGHYISRDDGKKGMFAAIASNQEEKIYDTFDCPKCGCQVVAQERKRPYIDEALEILSDEIDDESEQDESLNLNLTVEEEKEED